MEQYLSSFEDIVQRDLEYVFQTYTRQPVALREGRGAILVDVKGREYIDCVAGIAVNNVGHCHPRVVEAIKEQAKHLMHASNLYYIESQGVLAEKLARLTGLDKVFFCNSGAEAVEAALKLARKVMGKTDIIAAEGSFHGRTLGALSTTYKEKYRKPYEPLIPGVRFVPYNNLDAIQDAINNKTCAVILEPIQGEGGINVPQDDYLRGVREACDDAGTLLILDEVQTGFGRTGRWFAKEHSGILPDIMTLAKAMGGGFPIGAMLARENLAASFGRGDHASTFGGNPLACAAALASIQVIEEENLVEKSAANGRYFLEKLASLDKEYVIELRGKGLMIGMELAVKCEDIVDRARERGVLLNCVSENILRFVPPLSITRKQIDTVVEVIDEV